MNNVNESSPKRRQLSGYSSIGDPKVHIERVANPSDLNPRVSYPLQPSIQTRRDDHAADPVLPTSGIIRRTNATNTTPVSSHVTGLSRADVEEQTGTTTATRISAIPRTESEDAEFSRDSDTPQISTDPKFLYDQLLLWSLALPLGILFAFGGRPTILTLCFGCISSYIFDLMGSIEGSVMMLILTAVGLLASLVWSARSILAASVWHFCIVFVMTAQLLYAMVCIAAKFKSARIEFDSLFFYMELLMFTTIPLLGSATITWFLCVEFGNYHYHSGITHGVVGSVFQPNVVFAVIYGCYLHILGVPRISSAPTVFTRPTSGGKSSSVTYLNKAAVFTLPTTSVQVAVYAVPVVMCPILYCAVNYWTVHSFLFATLPSGSVGALRETGASIASGWALRQISGLLGSALLPLLISAIALEAHYDAFFIHGPQAKADATASNTNATNLSRNDETTNKLGLLSLRMHNSIKVCIEVIKLGGLAGLLFSLQAHPALDDLKGYSGLQDGKANLLLATICLLVGMALVQFRRGRLAEKNVKYLEVFAELNNVTDTTGLSGLTVSDNRSLQRKIDAFLEGPILPRTFVTICLWAAGTLMGLLLRLPASAYPLLGAGIVGCSEYYQRWKNVRTKDMSRARGWVYWIAINGIMSIAATCLSLVVLQFCKQTIHYLDFNFVWFSNKPSNMPAIDSAISDAANNSFNWDLAVQYFLRKLGFLRLSRQGDVYSDDPERQSDEGGISAKALTQLAAWAFCQAISLPTFVVVSGNDAPATINSNAPSSSMGGGINGCIPGLANLAGADSSGSTASSVALGSGTNGMEWLLRGFSVMFTLFSIVIATIELLLREQDWAAYGLTAETVYPGFLMFFTAGLLLWSVTHLLRLRRCDANTAFFCMVVQTMKLLHFIEVPATTIATCMLAAGSYSYPFVMQYIGSMPPDTALGATYDQIGRPISPQDKATLARLGVRIPRRGPGIVKLFFYSVCATYGIYLSYRCGISDTILSAILGHATSPLQSGAACVTACVLFHISLLHTFFPSQALLTRHGISLLLIVGTVSTLLAAEAFGRLSFSVDPSSSTLLVVEKHPDMVAGIADVDQSGLFLLMSACWLLLAGSGVLSIRHSSSRFIFTVLFTYSAAQMLLWWCFPMSLSKFSPQYGFFQLPSLYCHGISFLSTLCGLMSVIAMLPSTSKGVSSGNIYNFTRQMCLDYAPHVFLVGACLPILALLWEVWSEKGADDAVRAILWVAIVTNATFGLILRTTEIVIEANEQHSASQIPADPGSTSVVTPTRNSASLLFVSLICKQSASLCIFWTLSLTLISSATVLDAELSVPIATLSLLATSRNSTDAKKSSWKIFQSQHPLMLSAFMSASWWFAMGIYALLIEGVFSETHSVATPSRSTFGGIFHNEIISIWMSDGWWYPILNAVLLIVPIPAIYLAYRQEKSDREDTVFLLAVLSVLSTVGAHAGCIRYLGVVGAILGALRCRELGVANRVSGKLI